MRESSMNKAFFGGLIGLLMIANFGCAVEEDKKVAGSTNPTLELLIFKQTSTGAADVSSGPIESTTAATPLSFQIIATPGTSGFDFQDENNSSAPQLDNVKLFCDHDLGEGFDQPGTPGGPFALIPAFLSFTNHGNELEIVRAVTADSTLNIKNMAIPSGFNMAALPLSPNSGDTRADTDIVTLTYDSGRPQAPRGVGAFTFSAVVVDNAGRAAATKRVIRVTSAP